MASVDIDLIGVPAFVVDVEVGGSLRYSAVNRSSEQATGLSASKTVGYRPSECLPADVAASIEGRYRECLMKKTLHEYDEPFVARGETTWWHTTLTPLFDPSTGAVARIVGVSMDITDRKRTEDMLKAAALTDSLTGLVNRRCLESAAREAMLEAARSGQGFGLILIDLDEFKPINDRFGHRKGDDVLRHVGALLQFSAGTHAIVARIGGDEFAILLPSATEKTLASSVAALRRFLDRNLTIVDIVTRIGASVGAAFWMKGQTFEDLLAAADGSMYQHKASRKAAA